MYDATMLEFCDYLEKKILDTNRWVDVQLKRLPQKQPWIYMVVLESWKGEREAYEVDVSTAQWIKVYG